MTSAAQVRRFIRHRKLAKRVRFDAPAEPTDEEIEACPNASSTKGQPK